MRAVGTCLAVAVLALGAVTPVQAQKGDGLAVLEATAARYAAHPSFCAAFSQTLEVPLLGQERSGTGRLCQAQPDLFAMRFTDPEGDAVVADGESVWIYYPSTDPTQVLKMPMTTVPGGFDFHRAFLDDPASKYDVTLAGADEVAGRATHRLALVPLDPASQYQRAEVWVDRGTPILRRIRITEENGNVRTVTLSRVELGAGAPDGFFRFTPPEGTQVIQR